MSELPVNRQQPLVAPAPKTPAPRERTATVVDWQGALITLRVVTGSLPPVGALLTGLDARGREVATLAMVKRLLGDSSGLGVAEVVTGKGEEIVNVTWQ